MPKPHGGTLGDEGFIEGPALSLESTQDVAMAMRNMRGRVRRVAARAQVTTRQHIRTEVRLVK